MPSGQGGNEADVKKLHMIDRPSGGATRQRGLTLVELMVAMTLGLVVVLGVVYVFSGARASHRHQESYSAIQEAGRIALEVLAREARMAGNTGCGSVAYMTHLSGPSEPPVAGELVFNNDVAISAVEGGGAVADQFTVVYGSPEQTGVVTSAANQIQVASVPALEINRALTAGDPVLINDCVNTEIATVQSVAGDVITLQANLANEPRPGALVMRLERSTFSVDANGQLLRNGVALVGGVRDMQLLYGIATSASDRSAVQYVDAADPAFLPADVVAMKVALSVQDGEIPTRNFSSTITLRNRAP